jgi:hypothetical protein
MATNDLTRQDVIRRYRELTAEIDEQDLTQWLRQERKGRDPNARDPGDHEPADVISKLKHKSPSEIDDEDVHHMSTLLNYMDRHQG